METVDAIIEPVKDFAKESIRLLNKCTKPDAKGLFFLDHARPQQTGSEPLVDQ